MRGWRPKTKVITGPAKPGLLGVLQAEHNLTIRMQAFPNAMNLRLVVDSQRLLSGGPATRVEKIEPALGGAWRDREQTYTDLQRELPGSMAVTISYIGARGNHLVRQPKRIQPRGRAGVKANAGIVGQVR